MPHQSPQNFLCNSKWSFLRQYPTVGQTGSQQFQRAISENTQYSYSARKRRHLKPLLRTLILLLVECIMNRMAVRPCCFFFCLFVFLCWIRKRKHLSEDKVSLLKVPKLPKTVPITSYDRSINDSYGLGCCIQALSPLTELNCLRSWTVCFEVRLNWGRILHSFGEKWINFL